MPKAAKQHTWTAAETRTVNAGRVSRIIFDPQSQRVEVTFVVGEESGGTFVERPDLRRVASFAWDDLPVGIQTDLINMEEKALQWAASNIAEFAAGTLETDPSS